MSESYEHKVITAIRQLRQNKKCTQEQMAFDLNISTSFLGMIERGERNLSLKNIYAIAEFFGMTPSEFLHYAEKNSKK